MRTRHRLAAFTAAALLVTGLTPGAANAIPGPAVIDAHDSFIPTRADEITSSASGTVYTTDIGGFGNVFLTPAPMTTGSEPIDLGPRQRTRLAPTISGDHVALPQAGATPETPVTQVKYCVVGALDGCPTTLTFNAPVDYAYIGNAGDRAIVFKLGTHTLGLATWEGLLDVSYVLPNTYSELPSAVGDAVGVAVSGGGNVTYLDRESETVTDLGDGDGAVLSPVAVYWYLVGAEVDPGVFATRILGAERGEAPSPVQLAELAGSPGITTFAATDAAVAWLTPNDDEEGTNALYTLPIMGGDPVLYARPITTSGLAVLEYGSQFLVNDRLASVPGFYAVNPGSFTGTLRGLLPTRPAITLSLSVSNGRAVYVDDTTPDLPMYLRSVTNASPGPETSVTDWTDGSGAISGPYVAFTRPGEIDSLTEVHYGRAEGPFTVRSFPVSDVGKVAVSGNRVLVTGGVNTRVIDMPTNTITSYGHVFGAVFGDYLATLNYDTGQVQRRNLVSGSVQTVRAAIPGCTAFCVDEDAWQLAVWGNEVVFAFSHGGTTPGTKAGLWDGNATTTTNLSMLIDGTDPTFTEVTYWDGLLLVARNDATVHLYDMHDGAADHLIDDYAEEPFALDGDVVAWRPLSDLRAVVRVIDDFVDDYAARPRYLGGNQPAGFGGDSPAGSVWTPTFLTSQDVTGNLLLHSGSPTGPVVRSLSFTSEHGVINPTWNGEDGDDEPVVQGSYWWTIDVNGAETTPLLRSDGVTPASGRVWVSRSALGPPTLTAPVLVSDVSTTDVFNLTWTTPAGAPSGTSYGIVRSVNGGAPALWATTTNTSLRVASAARGNTYRYTVTAVDPAGRVGTPSAQKTTVVPYNDISAGVVLTGPWSNVSNTNEYAFQHRTSSTAGATFTFHAVGNTIWLVGNKGAGYGQFQVSIDGGAYSGTYDAYSPTTKFRQVLYSRGSLSNANHTIKIRVYGTRGRPLVSVDAIAFRR
ncbi:MAG: hypothetical protein QOE45_3382 [Frankiaceae bacterium]|jgi:hypothetical protein|nr:hypothetical protein [Frankiaceae bacterium]